MYTGTSSNIGLLTAKITVFRDAGVDPISDFKDGIDSQTVLDRFTELDHSDYCLG